MQKVEDWVHLKTDPIRNLQSLDCDTKLRLQPLHLVTDTMRGLLMLALPISALRPSSTPRVPQTRRNTATLDAVGEKDVYWNNLELVDALSTKTFAHMPAFVSEKTIKACSKGAMEAFEGQGGHDGMYLKQPWQNSRIYYEARRL